MNKKHHSVPHVPMKTYDGRPMCYIQIGASGMYTQINRASFFALMRSVDAPVKQTYIDSEGGYAYFFPLCAEMADYAAQLKREKDAEDQRRARNRRCVYKNTAKCDGWRSRDEYGNLGCETCTRIYRVVSLNHPVIKDTRETGDLLAADTNIERDLEETATRDILVAALSSLSDADRSFILRRFENGMTLRKLADECGISDFRYAGKKANRIIARLKSIFRRLDPQ